MDYLPTNTDIPKFLQNAKLGYISRYALGRDYHKLIRKRLTLLAQKISSVKWAILAFALLLIALLYLKNL